MAITLSRRPIEALRDERRELLSSVQMTGPELRQAARRDELTGDQWVAYERLREINFLLRNAKRPDSR